MFYRDVQNKKLVSNPTTTSTSFAYDSALTEVINLMQNIINIFPIFKLDEMKQRFKIFTEITNESINVYTTRLMEELTTVIPGLEAYKQSQYIFLKTNKIFVGAIAQVMSSDKDVTVCV